MANRQSVSDYKFRQFNNYKVFTTKQWCENNDIITTVIRENSGKWQFLTEEIDLEDVRAIPLVELVDKDPTLNDLHNLKRGHRATRNSLTDNWQIVDERRKPLFHRLAIRLGTRNSNFHGRLHIGFSLLFLWFFFPTTYVFDRYCFSSCFYQPTQWDNTLPIILGLACLLNGYYNLVQKNLIIKAYKILLFILLSPLILYIHQLLIMIFQYPFTFYTQAF